MEAGNKMRTGGTLKVLHGLALAFLLAIAGVSSALAQISDDAIYGVMSIDVPPSATSRGIALLKRYRNAALKQPGNRGVNLLQQVGWPNRFVIYESMERPVCLRCERERAPYG